MIMSIPYTEGGRTEQKARTRRALIAAARELLALGTTPTVEQAAHAAQISRPTAYRYFANQHALLLATHPELSVPSLLGDDAPADPLERLDRVALNLTELVRADEPALRAMLRLSLDVRDEPADLPLRSGRRILWIEDALAPVKSTMPKQKFRRLAISIAAVLGIEMLVWLTDVAGMSRSEACELMRNSARALAKEAGVGSRGGPGPFTKASKG
jgi:AcrR family transcriptional regulator